MERNFNVDIPTKVLYGSGRINELKNINMPGKKAMVVTYKDDALVKSGIVKKVEDILNEINLDYVMFNEIVPNPTKKNIIDGKKFAIDNKVDFLIALGGGSVMDATKAIALYINNDGDLWDYAFEGSGKKINPKNKAMPFIAITTTSGTGSEVDYGAVITDTDKNEKLAIGDYSEYPVYSIVDPELTKSVDKNYTIYQGFDALFHATEVYISKLANPISDMVALKDIELVGQNLRNAIKNPNDIKTRENMSFANTLGGYSMTLGNWCTSEHSMEHAMSAYNQNLTHGLGLIIISKAYYSAFVNKHIIDDRFINMARALGNKNASKAEDFIDELVKLQKDCGVDNIDTSSLGLFKKDAKKYLKNAKYTNGGMFSSDPVGLTDEEYEKIYIDSFKE